MCRFREISFVSLLRLFDFIICEKLWYLKDKNNKFYLFFVAAFIGSSEGGNICTTIFNCLHIICEEIHCVTGSCKNSEYIPRTVSLE